MSTAVRCEVPQKGTIVPNMGISIQESQPPGRDDAPTALADVLFTPTQQRVLGLLFGQPDRRYQSAELIRLAASGTGGVHRFLTRLAQAGLVRVDAVGNQKFYQANPDSPVFEEMAGLIRKTVGLVAPLRAALSPVADDVVAAFVYGSIARGDDHAGSDIDLMVVSDTLDYARMYAVLESAETGLARTINPSLLTAAEWRRKRSEEDSFIARIASQPRLFVIGAEDALE